MSKTTQIKAGTEKKQRIINAKRGAQPDQTIGATPNTPQLPAPNKQIGRRKSILPWLGLSVIWILLDQITKLWVIAKIDFGAVIEMTSYFNLVHVLNPGAAFSFLAEQQGWQKHFLSGVAIIASIVIVFMMRSANGRTFSMWSLSCILGGALGNLIDRFMHGAVIDFLDFYWNTTHWPAFNVADIAISIGAVGLIIDEIFFSRTRGQK